NGVPPTSLCLQFQAQTTKLRCGIWLLSWMPRKKHGTAMLWSDRTALAAMSLLSCCLFTKGSRRSRNSTGTRRFLALLLLQLLLDSTSLKLSPS
ncbi:hypothetical protein GGH17_005625, partial [Coemansia sp. RSA 788]